MEAAENHAKLLKEDGVGYDYYQILNTETYEWSEVITP